MKLLFENWREYLNEDVGGFTSEFQLFIPRKCAGQKCEPSKLSTTSPVQNVEGFNKPRGGLWTSTARMPDPDPSLWTSEWNEWMKTDMPSWMHEQGILLKPNTTNVFHVENEEDAQQLAEEFPFKSEKSQHWQRAMAVASGLPDYGYGVPAFIDYEAALQKYDAIHWGTKDGGYSSAGAFGRSGGWDIESTVWRDPSVLDVIETVDVSQGDGDLYEPYYEEEDETPT